MATSDHAHLHRAGSLMLTMALIDVDTVVFWTAIAVVLAGVPFALALTRLRPLGLVIVLVFVVMAILGWTSHRGNEEDGELYLFFYLLASAASLFGWSLGLLTSRQRARRVRDSS
jgi:hypothetical protein